MSKLKNDIKKAVKLFLNSRAKKANKNSAEEYQIANEKFTIQLAYNLFKLNNKDKLPYFFESLPQTSCLQLRTKQLKELKVLKAIDLICKQNKINYWLSDGTLLGSYRHKGFIPWDDDIDISMLEEDYLKIKDKFNTKIDGENLILNEAFGFNPQGICKAFKIYFEDNPDCYVDIFLYRVLPKCDSNTFDRYENEVNQFKTNSLKWKDKNFSFLDNQYTLFVKKLDKIFGNQKISKESGVVWSSYNYSGGYLYYVSNYKFKVSDIFPLNECEFEKTSFSCPHCIKLVLEKIYGDIYKLPINIYTFH